MARPEGSRNEQGRFKNQFPPDTGCDVSSSCLDCPLPACKYDDPTGYHAWKNQQRRETMVAEYRRFLNQGHDTGDATRLAAESVGVGERAVYRARKAAGKKPGKRGRKGKNDR